MDHNCANSNPNRVIFHKLGDLTTSSSTHYYYWNNIWDRKRAPRKPYLFHSFAFNVASLMVHAN